MKVTCACCRFFSPKSASRQRNECHRHSPTARRAADGRHDEFAIGIWPAVSPDSWCGEFKRHIGVRHAQSAQRGNDQGVAMNRRRLETTSEIPKSTRTTFAHVREFDGIATTLPCWQGRDTWPRGGPRATSVLWRIRRWISMSWRRLHRIAVVCRWRHVARRSPTLARENKSQQPCHVGNHATRRNTVAHVRSASMAYACTCVPPMRRYFPEN